MAIDLEETPSYKMDSRSLNYLNNLDGIVTYMP